jgi:phosphoglycolate phosphatase/putative hydrolase of the HAD superfamily
MSDQSIQIPEKLKDYRLFIFDLDGTLYDQKPLRLKITSTLIFRLITFRISLTELKIISEFRKQRELHKGFHSPTLINDQFKWCANNLKVPSERVRKVIEYYMFSFPLKFLKRFMYPGATELLKLLGKGNYKIAVYSDFPVEDKIKAMGITADYTLYSAHEPVCCMKPTSAGLLHICSQLSILPQDTIFIGDREDTDGESARMAGIKFLLVDVKAARDGIFYRKILNDIKFQNDNK